MKKLMIAAVVVALAAVSQAAQIKWAVNAPGNGATYKDYRVYICETLADGGFKSEAEISSYLLSDDGNTGTIKNNRSDGTVAGTITGLDNALSGQTQAFKVVIVDKDGKGYWVTDGSAQIYTTETTHADYNLADAAPLLSSPATEWSTGPGLEPVPEPTSGLLMLLGLAGLALKRKRA